MRSVSGPLLLAAALGAVTWIAAAPPATEASAPSPQAVRWLALGDSFSSGEGIPGAAAGNPDLQGKQNCQRANGVDTDAKAYAVVAVDELQQANDLAFERPFFVACTGAITDDASTQISEMRRQVPAELALWDVVSMSFGGNNVLFADLIIDCLDAKDPWGLVVYEGCSVSEERLRARVDMLVGRTPGIPGEFAGEVTLPQLYDEVAGVVRPGGHVIVTGYPQLLEEPERWASWIQRRSLACQGILKDDIRMLRGVTGYLNEQIGAAVLEANERWQATGITFHFVDLASSVYETSENNADRHGLCASDQWINGLTAGVTSGDFRKERSFHPTQAGHQATGRHLAGQVRDNFVFGTPPQTTITSPAIDFAALDWCEGLDTAPALETAVSIVDSVCSWPWALVSFTEPQPRLSVSLLYQDGYPAEQLVYWTGVEEGAQISGYTPEAIVEYSGMPIQTARLLYDALGGADAGNSAPPAPTPQLYPAAACVAGSLVYNGAGPNGETALYQQLLAEFGYDPGPADGYFGENTWLAAINEISDNGNINGSNGAFDEYYPDEGVILPSVFRRLGIAC